MPPVRTLLICTTPRSGSTLLCTLLRSAGTAGWPESWFRAEDEADYAAEWGVPAGPDGAPDAAAFLAAAIRAGTGANGVFAARIMADTHAALLPRLRRITATADDAAALAAAFGPTEHIWLRRADTVAQAVSRHRATASGLWHLDADGRPLELDGPAPAPVAYDDARIAAFRDAAEAGNRYWEAHFARTGVTPHRLTYEDLAADPPGVTRDLLDRLGLAPSDPGTLRVGTARLADAESREWADRFRAARPD